eukprot:CAMPEP_0204909358 /NCGR_PEP_ID=MMETSP1397-20131031/8102_1 /ASSEMBLY_ACC=CAM_ASM_000891 /TAXON_ID=49980 /ORGANISM="Climacostomum Climacostomum virens, Strain Stock W-24" /LENGTH=44 /DNA_ID= /DNA_START= /DNA_END= /DNA_ORIENTATION=
MPWGIFSLRADLSVAEAFIIAIWSMTDGAAGYDSNGSLNFFGLE